MLITKQIKKKNNGQLQRCIKISDNFVSKTKCRINPLEYWEESTRRPKDLGKQHQVNGYWRKCLTPTLDIVSVGIIMLSFKKDQQHLKHIKKSCKCLELLI